MKGIDDGHIWDAQQENRFRGLLLVLHRGKKEIDPADVEAELLTGIRFAKDDTLLKLANVYASELIQAKDKAHQASARRLLEALSSREVHHAMLNLAVSLMSGDGGKVDHRRAADLCEKLINASGVPDEVRQNALRYLGHSYRRGDARSVDAPKSVKLWEEAAALGDMEATFNVGLSYDEILEPGHKRAVAVNVEKSAMYYRRAAKGGHVPAATNLGLLLYRHHHLEISLGEGLSWLEFAAERGDQKAVSFLKEFERQVDKFMRLF